MNVDFSPALILGMGLIAGGLALYQLRRLQPDISRDFDVIVSAVATFSGGILIFQVWCDVSQDIGQDFYKSTRGVSVIPCNRSCISVTVLLQSMFRDHQLNMTRYAGEEHVIGCVILCRGCLVPICTCMICHCTGLSASIRPDLVFVCCISASHRELLAVWIVTLRVTWFCRDGGWTPCCCSASC